jgi:hypothetical protein
MFGNGKDIMEIGFEKNGQKHIFKQVDVTGMSDMKNPLFVWSFKNKWNHTCYLPQETRSQESVLQIMRTWSRRFKALRRANEHLKEENMDLRIKVDVLKELVKGVVPIWARLELDIECPNCARVDLYRTYGLWENKHMELFHV